MLSQFVLQYTFYGAHMQFLSRLVMSSKDTPWLIWNVIGFSIAWSLVTCVMIFLGMIVSLKLLESLRVTLTPAATTTTTTTTTTLKKMMKCHETTEDEDDTTTTATTNHEKSTEDKEEEAEEESEEEAAMFVTETAFVLGAIVAIVLLWTVFDFGLWMDPLPRDTAVDIHTTTTITTGSSDYHRYDFLMHQSPMVIVLLANFITLLVLVTATAVLHYMRQVFCVRPAKELDDAVDDNYTDHSEMIQSLSSSPSPMEWVIYGISSTLGLMVGMGTQMILSICLWNNAHHIPYVIQSNVTIALFSLGWSAVTVMVTALACYGLRVGVFSGILPHCMHRNVSRHYQSLLLVRMEAIYIGWTLTGICVGWIVLDVVHHMTSQIYVSLVLFALSLSAFACILYFIPDDDSALEECDDTVTTLTEPLLEADEEMA